MSENKQIVSWEVGVDNDEYVIVLYADDDTWTSLRFKYKDDVDLLVEALEELKRL